MDSFSGEFFLGSFADFVLMSSVPITLPDLSVFHVNESEPASITSTNDEDYFAARFSCHILSGTTITFQAEANASVQVTFTGTFTTAEDVADFINAFNSGAAPAAGWHAKAVAGRVVVESLVVGSTSQLKSLEVNTILGFTVQTVIGTDQASANVTGLNIQLLSLGSNLYAVSLLIDPAKFFPGEAFFLMADVSPAVITSFFVKSGNDSSSVNFLS